MLGGSGWHLGAARHPVRPREGERRVRAVPLPGLALPTGLDWMGLGLGWLGVGGRLGVGVLVRPLSGLAG